LFDKDITVPELLLKAEALEGRLPESHDKMQEIKSKIRILKSGYNGEKTIYYHLSQIPQHRYHIFHDIRLPIGDAFFQIDYILLSPKSVILLDGKNHSGKLYLDQNQMIQEYNGSREIYESPISQAERHKILLRYWFDKFQIPSLPIESLVVISKTSTEVIFSPEYRLAMDKVCKANDLLRKIEVYEQKNNKKRINQETMEKLSMLFLKEHSPLKQDILHMFQIITSEIITGVQCPNCSWIPMISIRNTWLCEKCHFISKDAHIKAINDYLLLINPTITNPELRNFLHLPSSRATTYLLSLLNFPYSGTNRGRIYTPSIIIP
jgi:hypothetical protein